MILKTSGANDSSPVVAPPSGLERFLDALEDPGEALLLPFLLGFEDASVPFLSSSKGVPPCFLGGRGVGGGKQGAFVFAFHR